jgi:hypothetical protein
MEVLFQVLDELLQRLPTDSNSAKTSQPTEVQAMTAKTSDPNTAAKTRQNMSDVSQIWGHRNVALARQLRPTQLPAGKFGTIYASSVFLFRDYRLTAWTLKGLHGFALLIAINTIACVTTVH